MNSMYNNLSGTNQPNHGQRKRNAQEADVISNHSTSGKISNSANTIDPAYLQQLTSIPLTQSDEIAIDAAVAVTLLMISSQLPDAQAIVRSLQSENLLDLNQTIHNILVAQGFAS